MPTLEDPSQSNRQDQHGRPRKSLHQLISKFEVPNASWHASSATPTAMPDRNHSLPRLTTRANGAEENGSQSLCPSSSTSAVGQNALLDVLSPHGQASELNRERAHTDSQPRARTNEPPANDKISPVRLGDISNINTTKLPVALRRSRFEKAAFLGLSKYWLPFSFRWAYDHMLIIPPQPYCRAKLDPYCFVRNTCGHTRAEQGFASPQETTTQRNG
jgi:hypothetical protein